MFVEEAKGVNVNRSLWPGKYRFKVHLTLFLVFVSNYLSHNIMYFYENLFVRRMDAAMNQDRGNFSNFKVHYKIIWILRAFIGLWMCFHSTMKHKNDVSYMVGSISKLWEVTVSWKKLKYTYALRISSFSLLRWKIISL